VTFIRFARPNAEFILCQARFASVAYDANTSIAIEGILTDARLAGT
jgi:hypothetical protein